MVTNLRSLMSYMLYKKFLRSKIYAVTKKSKAKKEGEAAEEDPELNNLLTNDINRISSVFWVTAESFCLMMELVLDFVQLYLKIQWAILVTIGVFAVITAINMFLMMLIEKAYTKMTSMRDDRLSLLKDVLHGIKAIKFMSWEHIFKTKIKDIRKKEYRQLMIAKVITILLTVLWGGTTIVACTATLMYYVSTHPEEQVRQTNLITVLFLFIILVYPLLSLPGYLIDLRFAMTSWRRINKFLTTKEVESDVIEQQDRTRTDLQISTFTSTVVPLDQFNSLELRNINLHWPSHGQEHSKKTFALSINHLDVKEGTLNCLIGSAGSGKTALINAILAELETQSSGVPPPASSVVSSFLGELRSSTTGLPAIRMQTINPSSVPVIKVKGAVAYASQNIWLQNKSIRENILFGKPFDELFYRRCIEACQLRDDISKLAGQDMYDCGPDGANLSGGQRQRVALCRAIYQKADVYLLDDVLSAVDPQVADGIMQKAVLELLIKEGKTVLIALSQYKYLTYADRIMVMSRGHIRENKEDIKRFLVRNGLTGDTVDSLRAIRRADVMSTEESKEELEEPEEEEVAEEDQIVTPEEAAQEVDEPESNEEERLSGDVKAGTFSLYLNKMGGFNLFVGLIFLVSIELSRRVYDFWLRSFVEYLQSKEMEDLWFLISNFMVTIGILCAAYCGTALLGNATLYLSNLRAARRLFNHFNKAVIFSKMKFFDQTPVGRIINRYSEDIFNIDDPLSFFMIVTLSNITLMIGHFISLPIMLPWLAVAIVVLLIVSFWYQKKYRYAVRELRRLTSVNTSTYINHVTETMHGIKTIRAFKKDEDFTNQFVGHLEGRVSSALIGDALTLWNSIRQLCSASFLSLCMIGFCIATVYFDIHVDYSKLALSLTYCLTNSWNLNGLAENVANFEQNFISVERLHQYIENETEKYDSVPVPARNEVRPIEDIAAPKEGLIVFDRVSLSYQSVDEVSRKYALKDISFTIQKGEKVAFCGRTGSGKSSILNVLFRLYDIEKGRIFANGQEIHSITLKDLRRAMSVIPQFGFLFKGTLKENLDPENVTTEAEIIRMFKLTQFQIQGLTQGLSQRGSKEELKMPSLADLPDAPQFAKVRTSKPFSKEDVGKPPSLGDLQEPLLGNNQVSQQTLRETGDVDLNFEIANHGSNLSNGEKQIINFMRVFIHSTDIICLDEANSNVDPYTDDLLMKALFTLCKDKALIMVSHRLENLRDFDKIVVMSEGRIVEMGNFQQLTANESSHFNELRSRKQLKQK